MMSKSFSGGGGLGAVGAIVGGAIGAVAAGPAGAVAGATAGGAIGGTIGGGSGSASGNSNVKKDAKSDSSFKQNENNNKQQQSSDSFFAMMSVNVVLFEITLDEVTPNDISFAFLTDYANLPSSYLSAGAQAKYQDFLLRWGTHFIRSAKMGGRLQITKTAKADKKLSSSEFASIAETEFQAMFSNLQSSWSQKASGFKFLGFGTESRETKQKANFNQQTNSGSTMTGQNRLEEGMKQSEFTHTQVEAEGGDPMIAQAILDFYTPSFKDTFSSWLKSIFDYPKPIEFTLRGIDNLLNMNMDSLFPVGDKFDFGCSGKNPAVQLLTEAVSKRRFYYSEQVQIVGNKTITEKTIVYCKYRDLEEFKESFRRRHLALEKAIAVYLAEGPFPTNSFDIKGGKPGCETDTLESFEDNKALPNWGDMMSAKFNIIFDMPVDIPGVARKDEEYTVRYLYKNWFATKPGQEILHIFEGCSVADDDAKTHRLCVNNLVMTYDQVSGFFQVTPADYALSLKFNPSLPKWLNGAKIARAQVISLLAMAASKKLEGKALSVPCNVKWRNALRLDTKNKDTCIHFSAATSGHIFVIFSSIPKDKKSWYYLYISFNGVAYYKGMHIEKADFGHGLGTLGDDNLFESYFVCLLQYDNGQVGIQYGKADPDSEVGQVHSAYTFASSGKKQSISYYTFGSGTHPISFHDVRITKKLPVLKCPSSDYVRINGRCEISCHVECEGCRQANDNKKCFSCKNVRVIDTDNALTCYATCPPGLTPDSSDRKKCTKCESGTFKATNGNEACTPCTPGNFVDTTGATECKPCPTGTFCSDKGCKKCESCEAGTFSGATGRTSCSVCPIATATDQRGSKECQKCLPGHYADEKGLRTCKTCQSGTFSAGTGASACTACPEGSSSARGSVSCSNNCEAGQFSSAKGVKCAKCPAGFFSPSAGSTSCQKCPAGFYQPSTGQSSCLKAPKGKYVDVVGATNYNECVPGLYSNTEGSTNCQKCEKGHYASTKGSQSCSACPAGTYSDGLGSVTCIQCPAGHYSQHTASQLCLRCPAGSYNNQQGKSSCEKCSVGYYQASSGQSSCSACPTGKFTSQLGAIKCDACPSGYYGNRAGIANCSPCSAGYYSSEGQSSCTPCAFGHYSSNGQSRCTACPAGQYASNTGSSSCQPCPHGTYSSSTGQRHCTPCPGGHYQSASGKTSCDRCNPGTYSGTGQSSCSGCPAGQYQPNHGQSSCHSCPAGQYQSNSGQTGCNRCARGYYQPSTGQRQCVEASEDHYVDGDGRTHQSRCESARPTTAKLRGRISSSQCFLNYRRIGCFVDNSARAMEHIHVQNSITLGSCYEYCFNKNYEFFGLQAGRECSCSNDKKVFARYGAKSGECNIRCTGNNGMTCGGSWRNEVFQVLKSEGIRYVGCFQDHSRDRDLRKMIRSNSNSVQWCRGHCQNHNYFSLQSTNECFCGNSYGKHGAKSNNDCSRQCPGNSGDKCGNSDRNSVWQILGRPYEMVGCFEDKNNRDLQEFHNINRNSINTCYDKCKNRGFRFFAVQAGSNCFCGNSYGKHGEKNLSDCERNTCPGNGDEYCGGGWRNLVYMIMTN